MNLSKLPEQACGDQDYKCCIDRHVSYAELLSQGMVLMFQHVVTV